MTFLDFTKSIEELRKQTRPVPTSDLKQIRQYRIEALRERGLTEEAILEDESLQKIDQLIRERAN